MSLTDDLSQISDLCLTCQHFDLLITDSCKLGLTAVDQTCVECDTFVQDTDKR